MDKCEECGKNLGIFEGYYHPTLGKSNLVCHSCFLKVKESVSQWKEFILSNSFKPTSSEGEFYINWNDLFNKITDNIRRLIGIKFNNDLNLIPRKTFRENTLNHLNCDRKHTYFHLGNRNI